jgi:hypothetical protein
MTLDQERMNDVLFEEWVKNNGPFTSEEGKIFTDLKRIIGSDLSLLYQMNKMIVRGEGQVLDNNQGINFICQNDMAMLKTNYGHIELHSEEFRRTIAALVDIYEDVYPLGSVVELRKEVFKDILPIDEIEDLYVVITYRYVPYTENSYVQYVGSLYPVGNLGAIKNDLHFNHKTVKRVLQRGYSDVKEIAYLYQVKKNLIVEENFHSTGFITSEDKRKLEQVGNVNIQL